MIDKNIFLGMLLHSGKGHFALRKSDRVSIGYQVEGFFLLPCKSRRDMLLSFMNQQNYKVSVWTVNNTEYIRIQDRDTLKRILNSIPEYLIHDDERLSLFVEGMNLIHNKHHLKLSGLEHLIEIKNKMTRDDKNGNDFDKQETPDTNSREGGNRKDNESERDVREPYNLLR